MDGWTRFDLAAVQAAMPTDMAVLYATWVDANPAKATRLSAIVAGVLRRFRAVVETAPDVVMDEDPDTVPTTGFEYAVDMAIFRLGMEMGVQFAPEVSGIMTRIDVWLRMVASGSTRALPVAGVEETAGTPRYAGRDAGERAIWL